MAVLRWMERLKGKPRLQQQEACQLSDLCSIREPRVNLAYWKRPVDEDIELFARYILQEGFPPLNVLANRDELQAIVSDHLNKVGFFSLGKTKLAADIIRISLQFMDVIQSNRLRLILKVVEDDACRKFHTDAYDFRLLCTYFGQGTEWLPDPFVNRANLVNGSNEEIVRDWKQVKRMESFEVGILKGETPAKPSGGIVHRSPPIEHKGEKRFLLRLDSISTNLN